VLLQWGDFTNWKAENDSQKRQSEEPSKTHVDTDEKTNGKNNTNDKVQDVAKENPDNKQDEEPTFFRHIIAKQTL